MEVEAAVPWTTGSAKSLMRPLSAPAQEVVGETTDDNVNLRSGPGTSYAVLMKLADGTRLEVIDEASEWYKVATARGTVGWISADYFTVEGSGSSSGGTQRPDTVVANIVDDGVNLRGGPGTSYGSLGKLGADVQVEVLGREGDWFYVRSPRGTVGWVSAEYAVLDVAAGHLLPEEASTETGGSGGESDNLDAVRIARKYEGAPYLWGGSTPLGFDCSGFTQYVYRQVGVSLPRTANQQYSTRYGKRIGSIEDLEPGDLVYFERTTSAEGITHAGIYVGGGKIIAARSERLGVRYVSMYEPFWNSRFVGAIRPYR
jgi:SH3-like domain-containing protein